MKTRNRRWVPDRLGWTGTNLENRERFYFPDASVDASQMSAMVDDHSRQMNLYRRGRRRWISLTFNPLNLLGSSPLSHINMASLGQTCGDYLIYRQNLGRSAKSKISDRLGFSRHMKLCEICYFFYTLLIAVFFTSFLLKLRKTFASKFLQATSILDISGESGSSF